MKNHLKLTIPFILAFFLLGIGWGMWSDHKDRQELSHKTPLRVVCAENWLSEDVLNEFSRAHKVPIALFTYSRPSEFLRQMANSDGRVDVICTSSLLLKSLVQSHWVQKVTFEDLPNVQLVSVDFRHLPYDPHGEYAVPLFWNLYGFFGKAQKADGSWKEVWQTKRVTLWGEELNLLHAMSKSGVKVEERLEVEEESKSLESEIHQFAARAAQILKPDLVPISAEALVSHADWILLPLGRVARLLGEKSPYQFWLPEDGGVVEVGLLSVGSKATQPELAKLLIGELLTTEHALEVHKRLNTGVVHTPLDKLGSVAPLQRASALRQFPLNRFEFPNLSVEALPRFQKIYDQTFPSGRGD